MIAELNERLGRQWHCKVKVSVSIHAGRAAIGEIGSSEPLTLLAVGEAADGANALRKAARVQDKPFAISQPVFTAAGLETFVEASAVVAGDGAGAPIVGYLSEFGACAACVLGAACAPAPRRIIAAPMDREVACMKLVGRAKAIMLTPEAEWPVIGQEKRSAYGLFVPYVAVLAAIPEVAHFIGQSLIGGYRPIGAGLLRALVVYLASFAIVYLVAVVIDVSAARFGGEKNFSNALKLSVYSHTPLWLAGIFLLIPGLSFLLILGVYLLWTGLPLLMRVPRERALPHAILVTACALIPAVVLSIV